MGRKLVAFTDDWKQVVDGIKDTGTGWIRRVSEKMGVKYSLAYHRIRANAPELIGRPPRVTSRVRGIVAVFMREVGVNPVGAMNRAAKELGISRQRVSAAVRMAKKIDGVSIND